MMMMNPMGMDPTAMAMQSKHIDAGKAYQGLREAFEAEDLKWSLEGVEGSCTKLLANKYRLKQ